ncbi:MAG: HEAT repeat domain-containing protein [Planctomycetota bacterium]|jgi:hypothetical protein
MRKPLLLLLPLALVGAVLAQDASSPEELVRQLGDDDYAVREEATKKLVEMGEKAVPALEKALQSEDLEVRLRAGRALRAIHDDKTGKAPAGEESQPSRGPGTSRTSGIELNIQPGKVILRRTEFKDGEKKVTQYEAASLEELKKKHPELKDVLKGFQFRSGAERRPFDFDMDKFWEDWGRGGFDDDFWKRWQKDLKRDLEKRNDLLERWKEALRRDRTRWGHLQPKPSGRALGIRASKPEPVLDAQLQLRGRGMVMDGVERETPADRLGLKRYDIVLKLNGADIRSVEDLRKAFAAVEEGSELTAQIIRRGKTIDLTTGG